MYFALLNCVRPVIKPSIMALTMLLGFQPLHAQTALGAEISYSRSNMRFDGVLLNGTFDFQIKLFDAPTGGDRIGPIITLNDISVNNGSLKSQLLDFGDGAFNGEARFIDVKARQGGGAFQAVGPRQPFHPVAYALALPGLYTIPNNSSPNIIGGFAGNIVSDGVRGAAISGGGQAGNVNSVTGNFGTVGGGQANTASGVSSTIGGGFDNIASGSFLCTVGGGSHNTASGTNSTVAGGDANTASGLASTVAGGRLNVAAGEFSFAAGHRAKAEADGTFVWADSTNADFSVGGADRFSVRASGGAEIFSSANLSTGVFLSAGGGSWASVSDRAAKTNIQPVDPKAALGKVIHLPISTWNYTAQDASIRHIGPMAQDFHAAFGVGEDDRHITTIDADGVLFAAVQGLHGMLIERDAQIEQQRREVDELRHRLAQLEQAMLNASDREH